MKVNITDIEDAITYGDVEKLNEVFSMAEQTINNNETVILERRYKNAPPDTDKVFRSLPELDRYKKGVFDAVEQLDSRKQELFRLLRDILKNGH